MPRDAKAVFRPADEGSVAIVRSKRSVSEVIAAQTPKTIHGGRAASFISML